MILSTVILAVIGVLLFLTIALTFQKLLKHNESGFMHLLMAFMFLAWLPVPLVVQGVLGNPDYLIPGTLFGSLSLLIFIIAMVMQAGHLSYSAKRANSNPDLWEGRDNWMLGGPLAGTTELFAGFLKGIWAVFLTAAFWMDGSIWMGTIGIIYCGVAVIDFLLLVNRSLVTDIPWLDKWQGKFNFVFFNVETTVWYLVLTIWLALQI